MTSVSEATTPTQASAGAMSPFHLSDEQIRFFDENGYLILRQWVPQDLVRRLQAASDAWIAQGWALPQEAREASDYRFRANDPNVMFRVDYLHNKAQDASLELLGSPQVLAAAESLCGPNLTPTYESMVFKQEGDGAEIAWHQDAVHPRNFRIFNYDLYLDASRIGAGALRVIPGTQRQRADICALTERYGWDAPGVISVEMEPGDVLLHDVMIVHGSEPTQGNALRRTLYYEFRAAEEILADGPWDREWIERRMRLLPVALRRYQRAFPDQPQFQWRIADAFRPQPLGDDEIELKVAHVVAMPNSYCSAGDAGKA